MIRYIKSPNLTYLQPTGVSLDDPIGWTDVVTESNTYSTSNDSTNLWRYFAIKLNAGTKYTIKQTARSFDTAFWFYNIDKSVITSVDSDSQVLLVAMVGLIMIVQMKLFIILQV